MPASVILSMRCSDSYSFLIQGDVDRYAFPVLFPSAVGCFNRTRTDRNGKRITRSQWATYLMFHLSTLPHWIRSNRTLQEWVLHVWADIERFRLNFFRMQASSNRNITAADVAADPSSAGAKAEVFIPASFTGGANPSTGF